MNSTTLLIGATSGTGYQIAQLLLQQGKPIRILARNKEKAEKLFQPTAAEIIIGDLTKPNQAFYEAFEGVQNIFFTAGVLSGFARESQLKAVDFGGVKLAVEAAMKANFKGRFVYMTTTGLSHKTFAIKLLNFIKFNIIHWRLKAEKVLEASGLDFTIVRAGVLTNKPSGTKAVQLYKEDLPIYLSTKVSRQDVARVITEVPQYHPLSKAGVTVVWGKTQLSITQQLSRF